MLEKGSIVYKDGIEYEIEYVDKSTQSDRKYYAKPTNHLEGWYSESDFDNISEEDLNLCVLFCKEYCPLEKLEPKIYLTTLTF